MNLHTRSILHFQIKNFLRPSCPTHLKIYKALCTNKMPQAWLGKSFYREFAKVWYPFISSNIIKLTDQKGTVSLRTTNMCLPE